jgi:hypothetical protein
MLFVFLWVLKHKLKAAAVAAAEPQDWQPQDMMHFLCKVRTKTAYALCVPVGAEAQAEGSSGSCSSRASGLATPGYDALFMQCVYEVYTCSLFALLVHPRPHPLLQILE